MRRGRFSSSHRKAFASGHPSARQVTGPLPSVSTTTPDRNPRGSRNVTGPFRVDASRLPFQLSSESLTETGPLVASSLILPEPPAMLAGPLVVWAVIVPDESLTLTGPFVASAFNVPLKRETLRGPFSAKSSSDALRGARMRMYAIHFSLSGPAVVNSLPVSTARTDEISTPGATALQTVMP